MLAWQLSSGKFEFIATNAHIFLSGCFPVDSLFARSLPPSTFPIRHGSASSDRLGGARISIGDGGMGMTEGWMAAAAGEICCLLTRTVAGPTAAIDGSGCARRGAGHRTTATSLPLSLLISQVG